MYCKRITSDMDGFAQIESLQREAFPPDESRDMKRILSLAESERIDMNFNTTLKTPAKNEKYIPHNFDPYGDNSIVMMM